MGFECFEICPIGCPNSVLYNSFHNYYDFGPRKADPRAAYRFSDCKHSLAQAGYNLAPKWPRVSCIRGGAQIMLGQKWVAPRWYPFLAPKYQGVTKGLLWVQNFVLLA